MSWKKAGIWMMRLLHDATLVLLTLKIIGHITWAWWWVFAPVWIPVALVALGTATAVMLGAIGDQIRKEELEKADEQ